MQETLNYMHNHAKEQSEWYGRMLGLIVTHELCHALGTGEHAPTETDGSHACVMRYFPTGYYRTEDFPRTPADRFELGLRTTWPNTLCLEGNGQPEGSCWKVVRVSDKR